MKRLHKSNGYTIIIEDFLKIWNYLSWFPLNITSDLYCSQHGRKASVIKASLRALIQGDQSVNVV